MKGKVATLARNGWQLSPEYAQLIHKNVSDLLHVLRCTYGQYWIPELPKWDSREMSLGSYCVYVLDLKWAVNEQEEWYPFQPDKHLTIAQWTIEADHRKFLRYLTKTDWEELPNLIADGYKPSLGTRLLASTHKLVDQEQLRDAFILGVTTLEVSISEYFQERFSGNSGLDKKVQSFFKLPKPAQLISLVCGDDRSNMKDLEHATRAIEIRNAIVHEGKDPPPGSEQIMRGLLRSTALLLSGPPIHFPHANPGNSSMEIDKWMDLYNQTGFVPGIGSNAHQP